MINWVHYADEAAVDLESVGKAALERQVVAVGAKHVEELRIALEDGIEEIEFEIELALLFLCPGCRSAE